MTGFPPHITETAKRLLAERKKFQIVPSESHGVHQVVPVDELRPVLFQGSLPNCEEWLEAHVLSRVMG